MLLYKLYIEAFLIFYITKNVGTGGFEPPTQGLKGLCSTD